MTWFQALILGIIQGLTEFLPVSSSGHLEIGNVLLGVQTKENLLFAVVVHAATAASTIVVFRRDIASIFKDLLTFRWNESYSYALKILISMIPVGVIGILFEDDIEAFFSGDLLLVGCCLLFTAVLLTFTYFKKSGDQPVGFVSGLVIGLAQAIAIMPGISRSGATIATALLLGVEKSHAARFSFLMVLIPILGAASLKLKDFFEPTATAPLETIGVLPLIVGFLAAFISGFIACKWMIDIVKRGKLIYFGIYCALVGMIAIISSI